MDTDEYVHIATEAGSVLMRRASVPSIAELDSIIFDIDGVLIDVTESIQLVHSVAAERYFRSLGWANCGELVTPSDVDAFKLAEGFNSDWDLAFAWMLLYLFKSRRYASTDGAVLRTSEPTIEEFTAELAKRGGGLGSAVAAVQESCSPEEWAAVGARWDRPKLKRLFIETYSGELCPEVYGFEPRMVKGPGLIRKDKAILDRGLISAGMKYGIATGRTNGETAVAIRLAGWGDLFPPDVIVSENDGFKKPDPKVLEIAVERLGAGRPMYIGDMPDDLLTVRRYNEIRGGMLACMVLTGLVHPSGPSAKERFIEQRADMIADNVNAALIAVDRCRGGTLCPAEKQR